MLARFAEPLFAEKGDARAVVGGGVDHDHAHPLLAHAALDFPEQAVADPGFLNVGPHAEPDQVAVLPGGTLLFDRGAEGEADDAAVQFADQAQVAVGVEQGGDLVLVPGAVQGRRVFGREDRLADVKDLRQIVDGHFAHLQLPVPGQVS